MAPKRNDAPNGTSNYSNVRRILEDLRLDLLQQSENAKAARAPVTLDQQSVGRLSRQDALQQQAMANAQEQRRKLDLRRIDQALLRLENKEYGWCEACGEAIAPRRLAIDPLVQMCVGCAQ